MGFSIDYGGYGLFGAILIGALIVVGVIVAVVAFRTVEVAREDVIEDEHDNGKDGPIA